MKQFKQEPPSLNLEPPTRIDRQMVQRWMAFFGSQIASFESELTALDSAIGDGDHGVNMRRGLYAVNQALDGTEVPDICGPFRVISTTLLSSVGGASGPLYGTFFLQCSHFAPHKSELSLADFTAAVDGGCRGVMHLGKAAGGDKTMVDTLLAAVSSLRRSASRHLSLQEALETCAKTTLEAARSTIPMVARKGRASYLGERSAGHLDPGALSASLLFESLSCALFPTSFRIAQPTTASTLNPASL